MYLSDAFRNVTEMVMAHFTVRTDENGGPCHSSSGGTHATYGRWPGSHPGLFLWDLWWTKWQWDWLLRESFGFPCQCHCISVLYLLIYFPGRRQRAHQVAQSHRGAVSSETGKFSVKICDSVLVIWSRLFHKKVKKRQSCPCRRYKDI
jgi:hypothetical protein